MPGYASNDLGQLFCLRCHDKMGVPICGACRRPIEERVVTALGKHWHVEVRIKRDMKSTNNFQAFPLFLLFSTFTAFCLCQM